MSERVPGDAAAMVEAGKHITTLSGAFERAGNGFKAIDTGGWYGDAADGFHQYLDTAAPKWFRAADAFEQAGKAVTEYAAVLEAAQQRATQASAELAAAQQRSNAAREQHNAAVEQANAGNGPPPPPFRDPAADDIAAARDAIARAEADVQAAGDRAARAVLAAAGEAPAEPGMLSKLKQAAGSHLDMFGNMVGNVGEGVITGLDSMVQGVRMLNPFDPYTMTHPAGYVENLGAMGQGLAHSVTHPVQAFKTAVNWDMWGSNPAKAFGTLVPSIAGTLLGGAGVAGKASGVAGKLAGGTKPDTPSRTPGPHPGWGPPAAGHPGGGQPSTGTPWGTSDLPPGPSNQTPTDLSGPRFDGGVGPRPDGGFGPMGSAEGNIPWRPSTDPAPSLQGDRDFYEPPAHTAPEAPGQPQRWDDSSPDPVSSSHGGLDQPGGNSDLPGHDPGTKFEEARLGGDPYKLGEHPWDFAPGTDDLPEGLSRSVDGNPYEGLPGHAATSDDPGFLYRDVDPLAEQNALYRKIQGVGLDDFFNSGINAHSPGESADLGSLNGHVGGNTGASPFISTSDSLGHVLNRDGGFNDGVVLDIRAPSAIDVDATLHNASPSDIPYMSHGEGEKVVIDHVPPEWIRGGWQHVSGPDGQEVRWFDNPNFDPARVTSGSRP